MGVHTIQFTWNILIREPHCLTVTRIGHTFLDTLVVELDGERVVSRTVRPWEDWGLVVGRQQIRVEDRPMELRWRYNSTGDPKSILLVDDKKIIAQYGNRSAAKRGLVSEEIAPENQIPLLKPEAYTYAGYVFWSPLSKWFFRVLGQFGSPALPPVSIHSKHDIDLGSLGREAGVQDEQLLRRLATHSERLKTWRKTALLIYSLTWVVFMYLLWRVIVAVVFYIDTTNLLFILLPSYVLGLSMASISLRLAYGLSSKAAVETLCVATIVYILVELKQDDALIHPDKKQVLIARMGYLAQQTTRLAKHYQTKKTSLRTRDWVEKHFEAIRLYIQDHECWLYAPRPSTLDDLRRDVYNLVAIFSSGNYGEFTYEPVAEPAPEPKEEKKRSDLSGLQAMLPKAILVVFGILLPGFLLLRLPADPAAGQQGLAGLNLPVARSLLVTLLSLSAGKLFNTDVGNLGLAANSNEPAQTS